MALMNAKPAADNPQISNRILAGTDVVGDIQSTGDVRVDGRIKGNLKLAGKLVIGEKGWVEGEVHCAEATVGGAFKGKLHIKGLLTLQATSKVQADVVTGKLAVEPGAEFAGQCAMTSVVRALSDSDAAPAPSATPTEKRAV